MIFPLSKDIQRLPSFELTKNNQPGKHCRAIVKLARSYLDDIASPLKDFRSPFLTRLQCFYLLPQSSSIVNYITLYAYKDVFMLPLLLVNNFTGK